MTLFLGLFARQDAETIEKQDNSVDMRLEYLRMWSHYSELMWSRVQTTYLIHGSMLIAWYFLHTGQFPAIIQAGALFVGIILGYFLFRIIERDSKYMKLYSDVAGELFMHTDEKQPIGKIMIKNMLWTLSITETILVVYTFISPVYTSTN